MSEVGMSEVGASLLANSNVREQARSYVCVSTTSASRSSGAAYCAPLESIYGVVAFVAVVVSGSLVLFEDAVAAAMPTTGTPAATMPAVIPPVAAPAPAATDAANRRAYR